MSDAIEQAVLRTPAYHKARRELRVRQSKIACFFVLTLMPAGIGLDYAVYPGHWVDFLLIRLACDALVLPVFVLLFTPFGRRWIRVLDFLWLMTPVISICTMIHISGDAGSPYYAGLSLIIFGSCILVPFTATEAAANYGAINLAYLVTCFPLGVEAADMGIVINNAYFILVTSIISVTTRYFANRTWDQEFELRHELNLRNQKLAEMDKLRSQFFAGISHEFRTPLTLIVSPVEQMLQDEDQTLPEHVGEQLMMVRSNGLRLLKLINDLLEIIRLEEGRVRLARENVDTKTLVSGIVSSLQHLASRKRLELKLEIEPNAPAIHGDPNRLEKIIVNLLTNAIKFTPEGGCITVRVSHVDDAARIEVRDTGIGIAENELPYIFDRFRQADGSATREYQGVGLGLALAKELTEEHGGTLSVSSTVGAGTTFTIILPIGQADLEQASSTAPKKVSDRPLQPQSAAMSESPQTTAISPINQSLPPKPQRGDAARNGEGSRRHDDRKMSDDATRPNEFARIFKAADTEMVVHETELPKEFVGQGDQLILVVDDEPDMRHFIVSRLRDKYRVLQAAEGRTGLQMALDERPDLILLDLMLPGMTGLDVCRELRKHDPDRKMKIIVLTAKMDEGSNIEALNRGADDFLLKPFSVVMLRTHVENLLQTSQLQKKLQQRHDELEETLAQLRQTEAQLIQSEKMNALGSLSAGLLHEINNPLNYTLTAMDVAKATLDPSDETMREIFQDIVDGMSRIRDIVTDLREFAYPEQAGERRPFRFDEAVRVAMRFLATELGDVHVDVGLVQHDLSVLGSKTHVTQLLVNLLSNALWAARQAVGREPHVELSAEARDGRIVVSIQDNGVGIAGDKLSRVFDPGYTTKDVGEGMGMGLSICHTIVKNHGGQIAVDSRLDQWTRFTFDLPLAGAATHQPELVGAQR